MTPGQEGTEPPTDFVRAWVVVLRRRAGWGVGVFTAVVGLALAVLYASTPTYRAEARLRLGEPPPASGVSPNAGVFSFLRLGGDPFANDLELLASRSLAESLVREVALGVRLEGPRGVFRDSVVSRLTHTDSTGEARFEVVWTDASTVRVRRVSPRDSVIGSFPAGSRVRFGAVEAVFRTRAEGSADPIHLRTQPFGEVLRTVSGRLALERTRREANVLEISYVDTDPGVALAVVRSSVRAFMAMRSDLMRRESGETADSLRTVAANTAAELRRAEDEVESLQRGTGLVAPEAQSAALIERFESALARLESARAELSSVTTQLGRVDDAGDRIEAWSTLIAHPRFLDNQTIGELLARLTELEGRRVELGQARTPDSREVQAVERQIEQLDGALRTLALEFTSTLGAQVADLDERVGELRRELARVPRQVLELGRRQRDVRVLAELLVITEQRLRQEELRQALAYSNVQVIDPPALQHRPVWPRPKLGLAVGLVLGLGAALLAMVTVERADGSVRSARQVRTLTGAPVLAVLPVRGGVDLSPQDRAAVLRSAGPSSSGGAPAVGAVELSDGDRATLEAALAGEFGASVRVVALRGFGATRDALDGGTSLLLAVRIARTPRTRVAAAVEWIRDAGGSVAGTIVLVDGPRQAEAVWE